MVSARQNGRLSAEELLKQAEDLLNGMPVYPHGDIIRLGIAAAEKLDATPGMAIDVVLKLMSSTEREVRAVVAAMIFRFARFQPGFWVDTVKHLISDEDWEVRDLAMRAFDTQEFGEGAAEFHLEFVLETLRTWMSDPDTAVRRTPTQALLGYAAAHPEFRPKLLELLEPLRDDSSEYVRDNYAVALRKLGRLDPALVMDYIERSLAELTEESRAIFRAALHEPWAAKLPQRKSDLLAKLTLLNPPAKAEGD